MYFNTEAKETGKGVLTPALKAFVAGLQNQRVLPADALPGLMSGQEATRVCMAAGCPLCQVPILLGLCASCCWWEGSL